MFSLIGGLVGLVLALTGSGGAIIGMPLLIHVAGYSLKQASVLSLHVVGMAALVSMGFVWKKIQWKVVASVVIPAFIMSFLAAWLKPYFSSGVIVGIIALIACLAFFQTWFPTLFLGTKNVSSNRFASVFIGSVSGLLTTLTGLGGGVVLFPLFKRFLRLPDDIAAATSMAVVLVNVCVSALFQWSVVLSLNFTLVNSLELISGFLLANLVVVMMTKLMNPKFKQGFVKILYSVVLVVSVLGLVI